MKKVLLLFLLLYESSFLFSQTIQDVVINKGDFKWVSIYTSGSNGFGYNSEKLGSCSVVGSVSGSSAKISGLSRGYGIFYTWSGNTMKYYSIKVVDVVNIDIPENLRLTIGENYTYTPIITDTEAVTALTWASSNTSVATVSSSGVITAVAPGKTTITCTAANGIKAQSVVTVSPCLLSDITLDKQTHDMNVGDNVQVTPTYSPNTATTKAVKWMSGNDNVAQVDSNGNVTAIAPGYCSIYAIASDGSGKFDKCLIHVAGASAVRGDINGDGGVTPQDASIILQYVAKKITW